MRAFNCGGSKRHEKSLTISFKRSPGGSVRPPVVSVKIFWCFSTRSQTRGIPEFLVRSSPPSRLVGCFSSALRVSITFPLFAFWRSGPSGTCHDCLAVPWSRKRPASLLAGRDFAATQGLGNRERQVLAFLAGVVQASRRKAETQKLPERESAVGIAMETRETAKTLSNP